MLILGPKKPHLPNFEQTKNFHQISKTVTLNQFLLPVITYNLREV